MKRSLIAILVMLISAPFTLAQRAEIDVAKNRIPLPGHAITTNCTGGQSWNSSTGKCECRNNFYWNEKLKQCRPLRTCPPDQIFDRDKDVCTAPCTGGQSWNSSTGKCECRNNFYWNERLKQCRPLRTCPPDQIFDRDKDFCTAPCTGGQSWNSSTNKCECRNNFYWNEKLKQCRPLRTCPPDQIFDRDKDFCIVR